ncbi:MAG: hypothetical protein KME49_26895 [Brasilonema octagenarum HA4186-MV1]|nr:hypothetical protein [Brasilonema octagenarum HA4186-MV1]
MTYSEQLCPWCIIRTLPNKQPVVVARFRRRDDAVAYSQVLQRLVENVVFAITFDPQAVKKSPEK